MLTVLVEIDINIEILTKDVNESHHIVKILESLEIYTSSMNEYLENNYSNIDSITVSEPVEYSGKIALPTEESSGSNTTYFYESVFFGP
eukprot:UN21771